MSRQTRFKLIGGCADGGVVVCDDGDPQSQVMYAKYNDSWDGGLFQARQMIGYDLYRLCKLRFGIDELKWPEIMEIGFYVYEGMREQEAIMQVFTSYREPERKRNG